MADERHTELAVLSLPRGSLDTIREALDEGALDELSLADLLDETGEDALDDFLTYAEDTGSTPVSIDSAFLDWLIDTRQADVQSAYDSLDVGDAVEFEIAGHDHTFTGEVEELRAPSGEGEMAEPEMILSAHEDPKGMSQYGLTPRPSGSIGVHALDGDNGEGLGYVVSIAPREASQ